jgi:N-acetylmuramoyl-L-alanine amidase
VKVLSPWKTRQIRIAAALLSLLVLASPLFARNVAKKKQLARSHFETAERMREALNGIAPDERTRRDYQRVTDAYRRVYYTAPTSSKADSAVVAVAELLAETGRRFNDEKTLQAAIGQYEFLRREYPGSKYRMDALFTIGQIYKEDLRDNGQAKATFQEFLKHYPRNNQADDARAAIAEIDAPPPAPPKKENGRSTENGRLVARTSPLPLVTGIRSWSTPDYTRVAIDLETEVKYEAGRIAHPDRIFFDLHDTKLASTLVGKTFDVQDGFLRRIRVAQFQRGLTRIVLEVDDISDYSVFLLPNPYRLIIDIHGKQAPKTLRAKNEEKESPKATAKLETPPLKISDEDEPPTKKKALAPASEVAKLKGTPQPSTGQPEMKKPVPVEAKADAAKPATTKLISDEETVDAATVATVSQPELKSTTKPTTEPTFESVAPREVLPLKKRSKAARAKEEAAAREARPTSNGDRSLIRALGLKIGKIVVDAGHGGHDTGTIGPNGLQEKDLVLDVALRLGKALQTRLGADVVYTRDDDTFVPLETRTAIANQERADLFISIHANSSSDSSARGVETYYLNFTSSPEALEVAARENAVSEKSIHELQDLVKKIALKEKIEESREFAADVQKSLWANMAAKQSSIRNRGVKKAPFIVLIGANMPSILTEISFLSNPTDERKLQTPEYRQKIADYIYKGVARYISGLSGLNVASEQGTATGGQN